MTIFEGMGHRMTKMNITFFWVGDGVSNTVFKRSNLNQTNWFWRHISPHICGSIGPFVSKNNRVHPWEDPHQPCEFHKNQFKTATCIITSYASGTLSPREPKTMEEWECRWKHSSGMLSCSLGCLCIALLALTFLAVCDESKCLMSRLAVASCHL